MELTRENIQAQEQRECYVSVSHWSDNASGNNGLIYLSYTGLNGKVSECGEPDSEEINEWHEAGTEIEKELENLTTYSNYVWDCKISLAEYSAPEIKMANISEIKSCFVRISHCENFYYSDIHEAAEAIIEHCRNTGIPAPNEIVCVINGYQIQWKFARGFRGSEIALWKLIQKKLHEKFSVFCSDASINQDATAMLLVPEFDSSNYVVPFDVCEKITTAYSSDELYSSPDEFVSRLPLNISEIAEYRRLQEDSGKSARKISRSRKRAKNQLLESSSEPETSERAKIWIDTITDALKDENCSGEEYRYYQYSSAENSTRKKNYKWFAINYDKVLLPGFDGESFGWLSAATYYSRKRRRGNIAAINCNFLIINWKKSALEYTPTAEQGKELVLSRCRELGLPEPCIVATPDGLEVKWYWHDSMTKVLYDHDMFNSQFNKDWDAMQIRLYEKFWHLGADPKKLCPTVMFAIPGSKDTRKTLKSDDRIIRELHKGETVKSYRDIQRILGLKETHYEEQSGQLDEVTQQKWAQFKANNPELVNDWLADVLRIHPLSKNWVCFGFIDENHKWNNRWTQASRIHESLMKLVNQPEFSTCDFYVSQGEFFSRNDRTVNNLASINVSFVDLDYKILVQYRPEITENPSPEGWEELIKAHCEQYGIPLPNDVVFSGGGVHLKWIYDEAASRAELPLWQYSQNLLLSQFKTLGADPASSDAARVLRLVGTENHKDSPAVKIRKVHVIDREFFSVIKISLRELVKGLEASQPENPEEFNAVKSEWEKTLAQLSIREANMLRPDSDRAIDYDSEDYRQADNYYWLENTLRHHKLHATYLSAEVSGVTKWIETYQLHESLRLLYWTPNLRLSLSELKQQENAESREALEWIPCNYVVLTRCPGETFEEKKANIMKRCREYREVGIPCANQIITIGDTLLVEWTYQSVLTGLALSRWQVTQEFLCRHFEDWGAMDNPEYLKATALLPVPGFVYDGITARLEYSELTNRYTFNRLAKAVLNFSQKEVEEYKKHKAEEKSKHEPARKIALPEDVSERLRRTRGAPDSGYKYGDFKEMALMRYLDIIKFLELQKLDNGEIPQNTRELCCFWALVFAKQAGLITTHEEFEAKAMELIEFCGLQFSKECTVKTLESAFKKDYRATTNYLIEILHIAPEYQKHMKVLRVGVRATAKKRQPREEWLAEHSQEREKPWEKLGISRATYFNWKKAGILPSQIEQQLPGGSRKQLDWYIYIMSAHSMRDSLWLFVRCYWWLYRCYRDCAFLRGGLGSSSVLLSMILMILRLHSSCYSGHLKFLRCRRGKRRGKRKKRRKRSSTPSRHRYRCHRHRCLCLSVSYCIPLLHSALSALCSPLPVSQ